MFSKWIHPCITALLVSVGLMQAAESGGERLKDSLIRSGGNRAELESALRKVKGRDTGYLIAHASQYDLVNLTAEQIVENVTYARTCANRLLDGPKRSCY